MPNAALTNQLKSLLDACCQLQARIGGDAKAAELLHCSRSLLTRLVIDGELAPEFVATAQARYSTLQAAIEKLVGTGNGEQDMLAQLHAAHAGLAQVDSPEAAALCRQLVTIEAEYVDAIEKTFRAQMATTASAQAATTAAYDKEALAGFLAKAFAAPDLTVKSIDVISGGFSKLTLMVDLAGGNRDQRTPQRLVLRSDLPAGKSFVGTVVADEYPILQVVHRHGVRVPRPYGIDVSGSVIGTPFMVLGHAAGRTIGTQFEFPAGDPEFGRDVARQMAMIHGIPITALGTDVMGPEVSTLDRVRTEIEKSCTGWQMVGRASSIIEEGFRRLRRNLALADGRRCLVHGDFGLHNTMVENSRVTAILDWEFGKMGNPADDLGFFYRTADHLLGWDEFMAEYVRAGGVAPPREQIDFYRLLGLIRVSVFCHLADWMFVSGKLPQIQYAPPYNIYLRGTLLRAAQLLDEFR